MSDLTNSIATAFGVLDYVTSPSTEAVSIELVSATEIGFVPTKTRRSATRRMSVSEIPGGDYVVDGVRYWAEKVQDSDKATGARKGWLHIFRVESDGSRTDLGFGEEHFALRSKVIKAIKAQVRAAA